MQKGTVVKDKLSKSGSDAAKGALDTAKETGKGNVRSDASDTARGAKLDSGARHGASTAGRGLRSGSRNWGGGGDTGASAGNILGGIGLMGVIVLIIIIVGIYLLLRS